MLCSNVVIAIALSASPVAFTEQDMSRLRGMPVCKEERKDLTSRSPFQEGNALDACSASAALSPFYLRTI